MRSFNIAGIFIGVQLMVELYRDNFVVVVGSFFSRVRVIRYGDYHRQLIMPRRMSRYD